MNQCWVTILSRKTGQSQLSGQADRSNRSVWSCHVAEARHSMHIYYLALVLTTLVQVAWPQVGWILYYDDELSCFFFFWGGESLTSVCAEHRNFFGARVRDFLENMRVTLAAFVIRTPGGGDFSCSSYEVPWQPLACEYHCVPSSMCWLR